MEQQRFFRNDDLKKALQVAKELHADLYAIVDKRSKNPKPRMYVLVYVYVSRLQCSPLWKRMWTYKLMSPLGEIY
jgi:hypothetical protein